MRNDLQRRNTLLNCTIGLTPALAPVRTRRLEGRLLHPEGIADTQPETLCVCAIKARHSTTTANPHINSQQDMELAAVNQVQSYG